VGDGLGLGDGVGVGLGVGLGLGDGVGVGEGLGDGDGLGEGLGDGLGDGDGLGVGGGMTTVLQLWLASYCFTASLTDVEFGPPNVMFTPEHTMMIVTLQAWTSVLLPLPTTVMTTLQTPGGGCGMVVGVGVAEGAGVAV
jgi:hypothetical protein